MRPIKKPEGGRAAEREAIGRVSRMSRASLGAGYAIHRYVVETPALKTATEEIRGVVETVWPELISKLPPKP
jgi:hypothetical protein